jgi:hypothetical protein
MSANLLYIEAYTEELLAHNAAKVKQLPEDYTTLQPGRCFKH